LRFFFFIPLIGDVNNDVSFGQAGSVFVPENKKEKKEKGK